MNPILALFGLFFLALGIAELWLAVSLPRAWPALRARLEAASPVPKDGDPVPGPTSAFDRLEANPRALLVLRVALAASALFTIAFAWGFVTAG